MPRNPRLLAPACLSRTMRLLSRDVEESRGACCQLPLPGPRLEVLRVGQVELLPEEKSSETVFRCGKQVAAQMEEPVSPCVECVVCGPELVVALARLQHLSACPRAPAASSRLPATPPLVPVAPSQRV